MGARGVKAVPRTPEAIAAALAIACPHCHVAPGRRCHSGNGHATVHPPHAKRIKAGTP